MNTLLWMLLPLLSLTADDAGHADLLVTGAEIHDGTGGPPRTCDVALRGDRIVAVGILDHWTAERTLEATGLLLAPGFIDLHNHSDRPITQPETRGNTNYLLQGVTTIVTGNCGGGRADVGAYLQEIDERGAGTNVAHLIPHGSLREKFVRPADRPASEAEILEMQQAIARAMREGAWGMSTGLIYVPGSFATTPELVRLSQTVGQHGGIYASHIRNEGGQLPEAIREALDIGRQANLPVHISHLKASGRSYWGLAAEAVRLLDEAAQQGQRVTADQYPYIASSTSLSAMVVPDRYRVEKRLQEALADPRQSEQLRRAIRESLRQRGDGESLVVAGYAANRGWQGKNIKQLADETGKDVVDVVLEIEQGGGAQMVNFSMSEEDVRLIMQQPFVATASDGSAKSLEDPTVPHPRSYGCFPRKIGYYAIERGIVPLPAAIRSASGLPADILGLTDRGYIKEGYLADLVLLDPARFRDTATYQQPHQYATGVKYLMVNGKLAVEDGRPTGGCYGRALRHASLPSSAQP
jgi:N-acyl-D-amino-acid deacylase